MFRNCIESKLLTSLGIVLFHALDYGLCDDEERALSKPLELLIESLTTAHERAIEFYRKRMLRHRKRFRTTKKSNNLINRESIVLDVDCINRNQDQLNSIAVSTNNYHQDYHRKNSSFRLLSFDQIMQMCASRLNSRESADNHYKAVCRALIAETLELSTFLDQISKGTKELRKISSISIDSNRNNESDATLEQLQFHDWARLWIQVIRELRHGVKLKKVDQEDLIHNTEYELTPYEMLLDDIRSRRYKLNKVMVNGDLPPRIKKDAHELILDFIRSRPPLVPVSKRILKPLPPKEITLYEKLMESIRQKHQLRPTKRPPNRIYSFSSNVTPLHTSKGTK
ncbi:hypothetical protein QR98_0003020 [Sarcoptes scabiei]|uniref:Uncharacterized protein n=1 Tax=Sarcoptes scabiei TaxID=52283 RepID=A0A131ZTM3_SARSC|nr:hypothetical protein QR98_0003020 [Sarcoptes scabiei]